MNSPTPARPRTLVQSLGLERWGGVNRRAWSYSSRFGGGMTRVGAGRRVPRTYFFREQEGATLRRLVLAVLLLTAAFSARAIEYTDVYYNPAESGWGFFLVQSDTVQFLAFFIYGPDGKPTWYTAQLTDDGTGTYTGPVYATTGTYFALPWNPAQLT